MAKLNTNKNSYIIVYAAVMVVVVAFLLAFVSSVLHDRQEENVTNDVKSQILKALHVETDDVTETYSTLVTDNLWDGTQLIPVSIAEFHTDYNPEIKAGRYHIFVATINGDTKYVLPVYGMGLWGPIWGYVALNSDRHTIFGAYFNHDSETAGLGAEIKDSQKWQSSFIGKVVSNGKEIILGVKKTTDRPNPLCEVDAVTGATLTSNGVNDMLQNCLANYLSFMNSNTTPTINDNKEKEDVE